MKRQRSEIGDQGSDGTGQGSEIRDQEPLGRLLRSAVPAIGEEAEPGRDLWPVMQARLRQPDAVVRFGSVPWFDWALAGGVALFAVAVPASIPALLYYL